MNHESPAPLPLQAQARALLDLVEADRVRRCEEILGDGNARARAVRAQAHADARARMRAAFEQQRLQHHAKIAAAQARLATLRRLQERQHTAALLRLAWEQLSEELLRLWQRPDTRAGWARCVLDTARARLPPTAWRILHAPDWPAAEQGALAPVLAGAAGARFEPSATIAAGLKVVADGNVVDGTLSGLLADRADCEARLLQHLEGLA